MFALSAQFTTGQQLIIRVEGTKHPYEVENRFDMMVQMIDQAWDK